MWGVPHDRTEVVAAAEAGDQAGAALLCQLEHVAAYEQADLRDIATINPSEAEMPALAHLWAFIQASLLEDPRAVITFEQFGVSADVWASLVGDTVWAKMFPMVGGQPALISRFSQATAIC